ncbi:hypothetical protein EST38_g4724 [Candolleomyces aberdarensis]|uniref:Uncharacterized protein n=1 Tax=Candolleomyces aberdarensis TaxID=2316362 RepID=A0A4Q2DMF1_9AGAR|nr:hypothetical protein EST38_g4724 [Candolleomyces aberdarensis]
MSESALAPIKVGFIGLSRHGWASYALGPSLTHSPALRETFKLKAVSTTSPVSAQETATKWAEVVGHAIEPYHTGDETRTIARDPKLDMVLVAVNTMRQKSALLPVIEAGKDFFVEWPAGCGIAETLEITVAAKKHGVRTMVGLQGRESFVIRKVGVESLARNCFTHDDIQVKDLIKGGAIGKVLSTSIVATFPLEAGFWAPETNQDRKYILDRENDLTLLTVPMAHQLETLTHILGPFTSVSATGATHYPISTIVSAPGVPVPGEAPRPSIFPDHISIAGTLASGILANVVWRSGMKTVPGRRTLLWEIDGEEGSIRMESFNAMGAFMATFEDPDLYLNGEKVEVEGVEQGAIGRLGNAWMEFAKGPEGNHATIDDAVKLKVLLNTIAKAMETGERLQVDTQGLLPYK